MLIYYPAGLLIFNTLELSDCDVKTELHASTTVTVKQGNMIRWEIPNKQFSAKFAPNTIPFISQRHLCVSKRTL